jgi:hypothetical protein
MESKDWHKALESAFGGEFNSFRCQSKKKRRGKRAKGLTQKDLANGLRNVNEKEKG